MQDVVDLLDHKVANVNENNPKANPGAKMLKPHAAYFEHVVHVAFEILGQRFRARHGKDDSTISTGLTSLSTSIGKNATEVIDIEEVTHYGRSKDIWPYNHYDLHPEVRFKNDLRIGDLIIDTMVRCGYIELYRASTEQYSTAPYEIIPGPRWEKALGEAPLLTGTSFEMPRPITGPHQKNGFRRFKVIKDWQNFGVDFQDLLETPFIKGMDKLQSTPWRVNMDVLRAVQDQRTSLRLHEGDMPEDRGSMEAKIVLKARSKNYALEKVIQKAEFIGTDTFWQYYDCDYRGRVYCREGFLNYQGPDIARGLFQFADGKPITREGIGWLAVHAANCFNETYEIDEIPDWVSSDYRSYLEANGLRSISVDKMSIIDRETWCYNNDDIIERVARENLFVGEKPVSFLAACKELSDAWIEGPEFITYLPIPIDGSNNGWQHLAAMSKDKEAGDLVSLTDSEIQADFYVKVARRLYDISEGETKELLVRMPMRDIRKGIAKRAAMTRAYSCGAKRMAESMWADCYAEGYHLKYGITAELCQQLSKDIITAIADVCPGPLETMKYMQELAHHEIQVNKRKDSEHAPELFWEAPSGFPVRYKAYRTKQVKHHGRINGKQIKHSGRIDFDVPDLQKFASGISPNFVHSQDAAHMILVASEWGGAFGPVHDSFSTHACDVAALGKLVRDVFVQMYDYEDYFEEIRYAILTEDGDFNSSYELGNLNIRDVLSSRYFFC